VTGSLSRLSIDVIVVFLACSNRQPKAHGSRPPNGFVVVFGVVVVVVVDVVVVVVVVVVVMVQSCHFTHWTRCAAEKRTCTKSLPEHAPPEVQLLNSLKATLLVVPKSHRTVFGEHDLE
jgi:hypothetical protein